MSIGATLALTAAIGYVVGSLPIGYILVYLIKGEDLRQKGSGRTGGTNAMRAAGLAVGVVTALADLAKGAGAVWIARAIAGSSPILPWAEAVAAVGAVTGHNWSVFLGLRGGAGTMPNLGAAISLWPIFGLMVIPAGLIVMLVSGYASVTSLFVAVAIAGTLSLRAALGDGSWAHACYGLATATLVVVALLPNIRRLRAGTERTMGPRAHDNRHAQDAHQP
jgi:glycerol-3-phosphate acyltransferase PlsY